MRKCEKCGAKHNGEFGSGRFCSKSCSQSRNHSENTKKKISQSVSTWAKNNPKKLNVYICEKCKIKFESRTIRKGRKKHCDRCRRQVPHRKYNVESIREFSKRTQQKILKRAKVKCVQCGWNEAACDIHHIVSTKKGGTDKHDNLMIVCPNCHRIIHTFPERFPVEELRKKSMEKTFKNWEYYYSPRRNGEKLKT